MNLLIINNLFDRSLFFEIFTTGILIAGLYVGVAQEEGLDNEFYNLGSSLFLCAIFFRIFLYIQKRVHKEVFFEMK